MLYILIYTVYTNHNLLAIYTNIYGMHTNYDLLAIDTTQSENYPRGNVDYAWKSLIIADYAWNCQLSEKIESWLSSIIQVFFYIGKCNFKQ